MEQDQHHDGEPENELYGSNNSTVRLTLYSVRLLISVISALYNMKKAQQVVLSFDSERKLWAL